MIQSIHIQNFQSHVDTRIELAPGVNVITGETNNGKTSVLRAIKWVTQNRPRGDSMLTRQPKTGKTKPQPKPCRVTITTERGAVTRIREKGFNGYALRVGDAPERRFEDVGASVPPEVLEVLNLGDVNVQEQLADFFLIKQSGGQVSKYVSGLLGFEVVDKALAKAKAEAVRLEKTRAELSVAIADCDQQLASTSYYVDASKELLVVEREAEAFAARAASCEALRTTIARAHEASEALVPLARRYEMLDMALASIESLFEGLKQATAARSQLATVISRAERFAAEVEGASARLRALDLGTAEEDLKGLQISVHHAANLRTAIAAAERVSDEVPLLSKRFVAAEEKLENRRLAYRDELARLGSCPYCGSTTPCISNVAELAG